MRSIASSETAVGVKPHASVREPADDPVIYVRTRLLAGLVVCRQREQRQGVHDPGGHHEGYDTRLDPPSMLAHCEILEGHLAPAREHTAKSSL